MQSQVKSFQYFDSKKRQRVLSYRHLGQGSRRILFFHGFPGSSLQAEAFQPQLAALDLQVLSLDRPGYHQTTTSEAGFHLETCMEDHEALLKFLDWSAYELISVSGGTPFLFYFFNRHSQQVRQINVLSGLGPVYDAQGAPLMSRKSLFALKALPLLPGALLKKIFSMRDLRKHRSQSPIARFMKMSANDLRAAQEPNAQRILVQCLNEALMQNAAGPQADARVFVSNWYSSLQPFQSAKSINFWHGDQDSIVPHQIAQNFKSLLGEQAHLQLFEGDGHYSLTIHHLGKILNLTQPKEKI